MKNEQEETAFIEYCEEKNEEIIYKASEIFLPTGFPQSVSSDYLEYQLWDTCQAFCSTISGTLAVQAVLEGVGVGSNVATPASAAVTWILKDGIGMLGRILFVWIKGSQFDSDCKKWRLFADILNDFALCLELYIPYWMEFSTQLLCLSTTMKALVGAVGGATRAALTQHQALRGNAADVSAKDGSQETIVNLLASCLGVLVLSTVKDEQSRWACMFTLVLFHIYFNYKAVRCLNIAVLNSERYRLVLKRYMPTAEVPNTASVNMQESVFLCQGTSDLDLCGCNIYLGRSLSELFKDETITGKDLVFLAKLFQDHKYIIVPSLTQKALYVSLKKGHSEVDVLKAYFHAVLLAVCLQIQAKDEPKVSMIHRRREDSIIARALSITDIPVQDDKLPKSEVLPTKALFLAEHMVNEELNSFTRKLAAEGWNLNKHLLQVGSWLSIYDII